MRRKLSFQHTAAYAEFRTASDTVSDTLLWSAQIEGRWLDLNEKTPVPLASMTKLFTALAAMYTMEWRPDEFHPQKMLHEFKGWEKARDFPIHNGDERANLTIHE